MAAPKLTAEQRAQVLEWIAADYDTKLMLRWMAESRLPSHADREPWPEVSSADIRYYRKRYGAAIAELRTARHAAALDSGLALKAERVARLKAHADALEQIKWQPDDKGRLWNEKAWREVLDDIAREMGHRRQGVDVTLERELEIFLDRLRDNLDEATYARVLALASGPAAAGD